MRGNQWPTTHKYVNYSGGSNTLNSNTQSRLLNSGLTLTELHIQRWLTTSHPLYPILHSTNCTKKFLAFWPAESTLGAKVSAAAQVKVVATAAASTIHREISTQAITIIGNNREKDIAIPSSQYAIKRVTSLVRTQTRNM